MRWATLRGVEARGALTESAVAEMWRLKGGVARIRPHADALVSEGKLRRLDVADGKAPVLVPAGVEPGGPLPPALLLSPFDNLVWDRAFLKRVFGFEHVIEIYKREHERVYGYYVLPLLRRDRLVGRADLKHDRAEGVLRVKAFHPEPGVARRPRLDARRGPDPPGPRPRRADSGPLSGRRVTRGVWARWGGAGTRHEGHRATD